VPPILSPTERRQRNREEMRRAILAAARAVMREQGVAALSLREVARRVRVQAPSLYGYFPNKMALYDALFLQAIRQYRADRARAVAGCASFWSLLPAQFAAYLRFAQEYPELYQLAFERPVPGFVPSEASMAESWALVAGYERDIAAAIDAGEIRPDVPIVQVRDLSIAVLHGLTSQHMANEPELPVGSGRYGALIPAAVAALRAAWAPMPAAADGQREAREGGGHARHS
jgi:AcrR family transcriptional regulator